MTETLHAPHGTPLEPKSAVTHPYKCPKCAARFEALQIAAHLNLTIVGSLTLSGLTTALWANECRKHKNTRKRLTDRTGKLELRLDKGRESSLLTREGTTREGDQ